MNEDARRQKEALQWRVGCPSKGLAKQFAFIGAARFERMEGLPFPKSAPKKLHFFVKNSQRNYFSASSTFTCDLQRKTWN